jgi:hypothetical protein
MLPQVRLPLGRLLTNPAQAPLDCAGGLRFGARDDEPVDPVDASEEDEERAERE